MEGSVIAAEPTRLIPVRFSADEDCFLLDFIGNRCGPGKEFEYMKDTYIELARLRPYRPADT